MRRFSLNPLHPRNLSAAIFLGIFFGFLFIVAWAMDHFGSWTLWIFFIGLFNLASFFYSKQMKRRKHLQELRDQRTFKKKEYKK